MKLEQSALTMDDIFGYTNESEIDGTKIEEQGAGPDTSFREARAMAIAGLVTLTVFFNCPNATAKVSRQPHHVLNSNSDSNDDVIRRLDLLMAVQSENLEEYKSISSLDREYIDAQIITQEAEILAAYASTSSYILSKKKKKVSL